jgi:hypothetical protein
MESMFLNAYNKTTMPNTGKDRSHKDGLWIKSSKIITKYWEFQKQEQNHMRCVVCEHNMPDQKGDFWHHRWWR